MPLEKEFMTYIATTPHGGAPGCGQEAKAEARGKSRPVSYWGLCGKGKAGQGRRFRISLFE